MNRHLKPSSGGVLATFALAALLALPLGARAGEQDFTLHNETGVEIHEFYVSSTGTNEWGEDILGKDTLPDGESVEITFDDDESAKNWDLKVVDDEGTSIEWRNLKLKKISEVTLHFEKGKPTADLE